LLRIPLRGIVAGAVPILIPGAAAAAASVAAVIVTPGQENCRVSVP
jgi:hypothetical protein